MKIIYVTKGNSGLSQAERGEMTGGSIKRNNQGDAMLACDFAPLPLFSSTPSHMCLSSLEHLSSESVWATFWILIRFLPLWWKKNSLWMNICRNIKKDSVILLGMTKHAQAFNCLIIFFVNFPTKRDTETNKQISPRSSATPVPSFPLKKNKKTTFQGHLYHFVPSADPTASVVGAAEPLD